MNKFISERLGAITMVLLLLIGAPVWYEELGNPETLSPQGHVLEALACIIIGLFPLAARKWYRDDGTGGAKPSLFVCTVIALPCLLGAVEVASEGFQYKLITSTIFDFVWGIATAFAFATVMVASFVDRRRVKRQQRMGQREDSSSV